MFDIKDMTEKTQEIKKQSRIDSVLNINCDYVFVPS